MHVASVHLEIDFKSEAGSVAVLLASLSRHLEGLSLAPRAVLAAERGQPSQWGFDSWRT